MAETKTPKVPKAGPLVFNAQGQIAGRVSAHVAKALLQGREVIVIEAQDAVLSGSLAHQMERLKSKRSMQAKFDPTKSPKFPRVPHMMFKRMVRGMLPKDSLRGRDALHRLRVYSGIPAGVDAATAQKIDEKKAGLLKQTTIGELCHAFGYKMPQ